jgi:DNA replication protein DnaC
MSMTNSDFNKILRLYDQRQAHNRQALIERQEKAFALIPKLKELHNQIGSIGLKSIQDTLQQPDKRDYFEAKLKETIHRLKQERATLLSSHSLPVDYLEPSYTCSDCHDTGYMHNERCHCLKQAIINFSYEQSNLKNILGTENFSTFSFNFYSKDVDKAMGISPLMNMQSVHQHCLDFVEQFNHHFNNLILYGQSGLGKTFLCNSIAKELLDQGKTVIYLSSFQLFRLFENYRFHKEEDIVSNDDIEAIFSCDLLIIDDLGTEFNNALTSAELFNCLNTRLLNQKSTVISTNLSPSEWVNKYSERIVSRIFGYYTQLKFFGSDIRLKKYR